MIKGVKKIESLLFILIITITPPTLINTMKNILSNLPMDIVPNILTYSNHIKVRNGKPMFQITINDPRINMLLEKYRLIKNFDLYTGPARLLNENHYIMSWYATIRAEKNPEKNPNNYRYQQIIRVEVVKFDRFKNGKIKQKSKVCKYSHNIVD